MQSTSQIRMQGKVKFFKILTYRQTLAWCKGPNHVGKVDTRCSYFIQLPHLFKNLQLFSPYESNPDVKYQCSCNLQLKQQTLRIGEEGLELQQEKNIDREPTEDSEEKGKTTKRVTRDEKVTFPETTSQMIGWKPKILQRNEVERHARGKQDIVKLFKWPREGV